MTHFGTEHKTLCGKVVDEMWWIVSSRKSVTCPKCKAKMVTPNMTIDPVIEAMATRLVLEMLPLAHCPEWRRWQLLHEATTLCGQTGDKKLSRDILNSIRYRGEHEAEVEATAKVLQDFVNARKPNVELSGHQRPATERRLK